MLCLVDGRSNLSCEQAKGFVNEYQPKFNSARAVYRERKKYIEEIDLNMLAVPPTGSSKVKKFSSIELLNIQCLLSFCIQKY